MRPRLDSGPTPMPRGRAARRGYWTDLTETQWMVIAPLVPDAMPGGRPRKASSRELINAILYALRADGGNADGQVAPPFADPLITRLMDTKLSRVPPMRF